MRTVSVLWWLACINLDSAFTFYSKEHWLDIAGFENCWIIIYRNPKHTHREYPQYRNHPISLPSTTFAYFQHQFFLTPSLIRYNSARKHVYCTAYFVLEPNKWDVVWTGDKFDGWRNTCEFWYKTWKERVPFRDGIDCVVFLPGDPSETCSGRIGDLPILNNIILPSSLGPNNPMTFQRPHLLNLTCFLQINLKACLLLTRAKYSNSGKTLILEPNFQHMDQYDTKAGVHDQFDLIQNYKLMNRDVVGFGSPFEKYEGFVGPFENKFVLIAADTMDMWYPTQVDPKRKLLHNPIQAIRRMLNHIKIGNLWELYHPLYAHQMQEVFVSGMNWRKFVTKHGVTRTTSYRFYFTPYDGYSWVGIVLTTLLIPLFFVFTAFVTALPNKRVIFELVLMLNVEALLHCSPNVSKTVFNSKLRRIFYATIGIWMLMLVILVEGYIGIIVSEVIVPLKWKQTVTKLADLNKFVVFGKDFVPSDLKLIGRNQNFTKVFRSDYRYCQCLSQGLIFDPGTSPYADDNIEHDKYCHRLYSTLSENGFSKHSFPLGNITNMCSMYNKTRYSIKKPGYRYSQVKKYNVMNMVSILLGGHTPLTMTVVGDNVYKLGLPSDSDALNTHVYDLIKGSRKMAFITTEDEVAAFEAYANKMEDEKETGEHYMRGTETFFNHLAGYGIFKVDLGLNFELKQKIFRRMRRLTENGMDQLWRTWDKIIYPTKSDVIMRRNQVQTSTPKPLTLKSKILTIFILSLVCVAICTFCLMTEIVSSWYFSIRLKG